MSDTTMSVPLLSTEIDETTTEYYTSDFLDFGGAALDLDTQPTAVERVGSAPWKMLTCQDLPKQVSVNQDSKPPSPAIIIQRVLYPLVSWLMELHVVME